MSFHGGPTYLREAASPATGSAVIGGGNGVTAGNSGRTVMSTVSSERLQLNPNKDHKPDTSEDLHLDFSPSIFSSLERYLPPSMLSVPRDDKVKFMHETLLKYLPHGKRNRAQKQREYRQKIISNYQPLH